LIYTDELHELGFGLHVAADTIHNVPRVAVCVAGTFAYNSVNVSIFIQLLSGILSPVGRYKRFISARMSVRTALIRLLPVLEKSTFK